MRPRTLHSLGVPATPSADEAHTVAAPVSPLCHDTVTTPCPICQRLFTPTGRQRFCSDGCRAAAYRRRRRDAGRAPAIVPKARPRRPITVYECDSCGERAVGQQRCETCSTLCAASASVASVPPARRRLPLWSCTERRS